MNKARSFIDAWMRDTCDRFEPLLEEVYLATAQDFEQADEPSLRRDPEDITDLFILRRDAITISRQFRDALDRCFKEAFSARRRADTMAEYALLSEDELQSHLVGQPSAEALERKYGEVLGLIDSRLQSLGSELDNAQKPLNPVAPRQLVTAFLDVFRTDRCSPALQLQMLHHFEKSLSRHLPAYYDWLNQSLTEAGYGLWHVHDHPGALLLAGVARQGATDASGVPPQGRAHSAVWSSENELQAAPSSSGGIAAHRPLPAYPLTSEQRLWPARLAALRERLHQVRADAAPAATSPAARELGPAELLAVIALIQGDGSQALLPATAEAERSDLSALLEQRVLQGARNLGIGEARLAQAHADAVALVGLLFEALPALYPLSPVAAGEISALVVPYLKLALLDPMLFDDARHPAWMLLESVLEASDAATGTQPADRELWAAASAAIVSIANEFRDDPGLFAQAASRMITATEARQMRGSLLANRNAQAIHGRERLRIAQDYADRRLHALIEGRRLVAPVADFLAEQWRHYVTRAWLRDGVDSSRHRDALALGDALVQLDADAANALGSRVADQLLQWQDVIRDSYVSCGLDAHGGQTVLAGMVSALANPDALRAMREYPSLAGDDAETLLAEHAAFVGAPATHAFEQDQALLLEDASAGQMPVRIAWISPSTGRVLLVNQYGVQQAYLTPQQLSDRIADGSARLTMRGSLFDRALAQVRRRLGVAEPPTS